MKTILIPVAALLLAACNTPVKEKDNIETINVPATEMTEPAKDVQPVAEEPVVDAVTSATAMPNHSSFNGKMIVPPQRHATVTLTMGGTVHATSLLPGDMCGKGLSWQRWRTLISSPFSRVILKRMHKRNIWKPNTIGRNV